MFVLIHSKIIYYSDTRHWMMGGVNTRGCHRFLMGWDGEVYSKGMSQASDRGRVGRFIGKGCHKLLMGVGWRGEL